MDLCSEKTLAYLMIRRKKITELEAKYYGRQILKALKYLKEQGVVHRDLKLGNLFLDYEM